MQKKGQMPLAAKIVIGLGVVTMLGLMIALYYVTEKKKKEQRPSFVTPEMAEELRKSGKNFIFVDEI